MCSNLLFIPGYLSHKSNSVAILVVVLVEKGALMIVQKLALVEGHGGI